MGFIWSLKQAPGQRDGLRLAKRDVTLPLEVRLLLFDGHVTPDLSNDNDLLSSLAEMLVYRHYMAQGVERVEVNHGRLHGTLFLPKGNITQLSHSSLFDHSLMGNLVQS